MRKSRTICALLPQKWYDGNEQKRSLPHGKENKNPDESA